MVDLEFEILELPAYRAIGLKWDGAYSEASTLGTVIQKMSERVHELEGAVNPDVQLGLSYHTRVDGFVHYSAYEVSEKQDVPEDMVEIRVPAMTYLFMHHSKGSDINDAYTKVYNWFNDHDYIPYREEGKEYFDHLPIKHERYPKDRDVNDPEFDILIPIIKK
ncbi:GyrI-like domain-containing protein [Falsibacillus pallidus]|uniref:Putative transcriptional regulator YdeE n=1 Tax=Falsibacillus pallidus TaxID=493781 RepID=A0A370GR04_9BACI|nr:GyrI-like domain-containing protein [Falsibacillus pallidus]RDI45676.1 putative transcriptional regulator YdeE [Falsibacillus pallidus]